MALVAAVLVSIFLTGCPEGGGGGGGTPPVYTDPIHTSFTLTPAQIHETGRPYEVAAVVRETRGDEININWMRTYRTLTTTADSTNPYANTYDTEKSADYFSAQPRQIYGYMFIPNSSAYIEDSTAPANTYNVLKGYGSHTIRTQVMIGREYENRPAWFNGLYISYSDYRSWVLTGKVGVKYWVRLEGYDYKLSDNYTIYIPLEIYFAGELNSTNPYDSSSIPVIGTPVTTNPYDIGG